MLNVCGYRVNKTFINWDKLDGFSNGKIYIINNYRHYPETIRYVANVFSILFHRLFNKLVGKLTSLVDNFYTLFTGANVFTTNLFIKNESEGI